MLLRRLGNKSKIAHLILPYFPDHVCYIEPFFGAGGMFFNKPVAKYNILNDIDSDIHNLYMQVRFNKEELLHEVECFPFHKDTFNWIKTQEFDDPVMKALKFVILSNYSYLGKQDCLKIGQCNPKKILIANIQTTFDFFCKNINLQFNNTCFRNFIKQIGDMSKSFIYSDPPYLDTTDTYSLQAKWNTTDASDCMDITFNSGVSAAMSEFDHPFILEQAKSRGLNVIEITKRRTLKNRQTEILITNYPISKNLF